MLNRCILIFAFAFTAFVCPVHAHLIDEDTKGSYGAGNGQIWAIQNGVSAHVSAASALIFEDRPVGLNLESPRSNPTSGSGTGDNAAFHYKCRGTLEDKQTREVAQIDPNIRLIEREYPRSWPPNDTMTVLACTSRFQLVWDTAFVPGQEAHLIPVNWTQRELLTAGPFASDMYSTDAALVNPDQHPTLHAGFWVDNQNVHGEVSCWLEEVSASRWPPR